MGDNVLTHNPFAVLTFIVAPALLTNASSLLVLSTTNRMLRTRERMEELFEQSEKSPEFRGEKFLEKVNRVESQAFLLLTAMRWIYVALGSFATGSLVTLLGAISGRLLGPGGVHTVIVTGLLLGLIGVGGLVAGCFNLFWATRLSLANLRDEAKMIRDRQKSYRNNVT